MVSPDDQQGAPAPEGGASSAAESTVPEKMAGGESTNGAAAPPAGESPEESPEVDATYGYYDDPYAYPDSVQDSTPDSAVTAVEEAPPPPAAVTASSGGGSTRPPEPPESSGDDEEDGMLRMSFLEHLQELRKRLLMMLAGIGVAFVLSLTFANQLWLIVSAPAVEALTELGFKEPQLTQITPMETFNIVWVKLPILTATFLASPWILYQVWAFIAPGLYRRERRWAAPFVIISAGLFIAGGVFAYYVAFRFGLTFLLGIGRDINIRPMVSVTEYFDLFVNVVLGVGLVFELPVLVFFLTLLRIVNPRFLVRNSRYAILVIVLLAAIITPTPDVVNLMMFVTPMCLLFYCGIFASYLLVLHRENRRFPWKKVFLVLAVMSAMLAGLVWLAIAKYGYRLVLEWPFLIR
jgi:sec-independent protein translocase protein TatC